MIVLSHERMNVMNVYVRHGVSARLGSHERMNVMNVGGFGKIPIY